MTEWKTWTPKYDGHAPDDWAEGTSAECFGPHKEWVGVGKSPSWVEDLEYRYRAKATTLETLTAQCLALPQADREALIEALQRPVRDWADDLAAAYWNNDTELSGVQGLAAVMRDKCQPKMQHVAYFDEGKFHWMTGIAPRDCELFAEWKSA